VQVHTVACAAQAQQTHGAGSRHESRKADTLFAIRYQAADAPQAVGRAGRHPPEYAADVDLGAQRRHRARYGIVLRLQHSPNMGLRFSDTALIEVEQ
jgi:hypothetical protein